MSDQSERPIRVRDQRPAMGGAGVSAQRQSIPQPSPAEPPDEQPRRIEDRTGVAERAAAAAASIAAAHRARDVAESQADSAEATQHIANACEALAATYADLAAAARAMQPDAPRLQVRRDDRAAAVEAVAAQSVAYRSAAPV